MEVTSVETPAVASVSVEKTAEVDNEEPRSERATLIQYRVQKGDSLWRVAAALTGRGSNWVELWPEYRGHERKLMPGSVLEVPTWRMTLTTGEAPGPSRRAIER
jgi:Tfp pilus assembly protein FimV